MLALPQLKDAIKPIRYPDLTTSFYELRRAKCVSALGPGAVGALIEARRFFLDEDELLNKDSHMTATRKNKVVCFGQRRHD